MHTDYESIDWQPLGVQGWTRARVILGEDDTAWNPASTKHVLYGPCAIEYLRFPSQITATICDVGDLNPESPPASTDSED